MGQNLIERKKCAGSEDAVHQRIESISEQWEVLSHEDRIKDMNEQADSLIKSEQFDAGDIEEKRKSINERYKQVEELAADRQTRLNEAITLHQFFRDIADEESWIKEKKLLVSSDDYGRDLTGVQNLKKKHKRLESELAPHEPTIKSVQDAGNHLISVSQFGGQEFKERLQQLNDVWEELQEMSASRGRKLDESITYQQFLAKIEEEEAWVSEKQQLLTVPDLGENMAAVQGLLKKHDAFETDLSVHNDKVNEINAAGQKLIEDRNHHTSNIVQRCDLLRNKMHNLGEVANLRKQNLLDNSAYLQFMWKADVVESWIAEKEAYVRSNDLGRDLSTVQTLLTKQETFDIGLEAFENEGISNITALKNQLVQSGHNQSDAINKKYEEVIARWQRLQSESNNRKARLLQVQDQFRQIEELFLTFAKKASAFNSWFENAEEDMTDPVRCNSVEEIKSLRDAHAQFQASLTAANTDFEALSQLDKQIKSYNVGANPYTWFTMAALEETWRNLQKIIHDRENELAKEAIRQV